MVNDGYKKRQIFEVGRILVGEDGFVAELFADMEAYVAGGFGIGKRMMMVAQVEATLSGHNIKLMATQIEATPRSYKRAIKPVAGIFHAVFGESGFQAPFVETSIMGDEREALDMLMNLGPHIGEKGVGVGVAAREAVNLGGPIGVIVGIGANQSVKFVDNLSSAHNHHPHAAYA